MQHCLFNKCVLDMHRLRKGKASERFIDLKVKVNQKEQLTTATSGKIEIVVLAGTKAATTGGKAWCLWETNLTYSTQICHQAAAHTRNTLKTHFHSLKTAGVCIVTENTKRGNRTARGQFFSLCQMWWLWLFQGCHWICVSDPFMISPSGELSDNVEVKVKLMVKGEIKDTLCGAESLSTWLVPKTMSHWRHSHSQHFRWKQHFWG